MTEWIVPEPDRIASGIALDRGRDVDLVVMHWTASPYASPAGERTRLEGWAQRRTSSTHFVIGRDGTLYQMTPLSVGAEHTSDRKASWRGENAGAVDRRSIGIDLMNVGPLERDAAGRFINVYDGVHVGPHAEYQGRWFESYTPEQMATLWRLVGELVQLYPTLADGDRWVGHEHVQPGKPDPGPLFPWGKLREVLADSGKDEPRGHDALQFFRWEHLPPHLAEVSRPFAEVARMVVRETGAGSQQDLALNCLLQAKDAAVRARLAL